MFVFETVFRVERCVFAQQRDGQAKQGAKSEAPRVDFQIPM